MGNSWSGLEPYRYHFEDPKIGDLDLSTVKVYKIIDEKSADAAEEYLRRQSILYVDCEGHCFGNPQQKLGTVQIATSPDCCLVFQITRYRGSLDFLKDLFESDNVQKVFHDCSGDSAVLFHENRIRLTNRSVDDTQVAHKVIEAAKYGTSIDRTTGRSLADLYMEYCGERIPGNKRVKKNSAPWSGVNRWDEMDLSPRLIKYAVVDALAICRIFTIQKRMLKRTSEYKELIQKQLHKKIKDFAFGQSASTQVQPSTSSNWGLFAVGAAAIVALGAAAAHAKEKEKRQKDGEQQKKEECIIS